MAAPEFCREAEAFSLSYHAPPDHVNMNPPSFGFWGKSRAGVPEWAGPDIIVFSEPAEEALCASAGPGGR